MEENKNVKLDDEQLAKASGGELDPFHDVATISGIVFVDPRPDDEYYHEIWESCQNNGYAVYELSDGNLAVAPGHIEPLNPGDQVYIDHIRGYYGYEIAGKVDGID